MPARRMFFGTFADIAPGLARAEQSVGVEYVLSGRWEKPTLVSYTQYSDIPRLGYSDSGFNGDPQYVIIPRGRKIKPRKMRHKQGRVQHSYLVDVCQKGDSIVFAPGGIHGDHVLISSVIIASNPSAFTMLAFKTFVGELTRGFKNVNGWRVGPEAYNLLRQGWRLTPSVRFSPEVDLRLPTDAL